MKVSEDIILNEDHTVTGCCEGTWELKNNKEAVLELDGEIYKGIFQKQWDQFEKKNVITFTALSDSGCAVWGSGYQAQ